MRVNAWWGILGFAVIIVALSIGVFGSLSNLTDKTNALLNNEGFSKIAESITNSTVLILVQKDNIDLSEKVSGAIYVDNEGIAWTKGTAFSIGNTILLTASHVIEGSDIKKIKIQWQNKEYLNAIVNYTTEKGIDFGIIKTNLNIPSVKLIEKDRATLGAKIGFIGFPLSELNPILHDGIISSIRNENNGFFWYTINSFVNRGNSGGPVFLADTGEVIGIVSSRQNDFPQLLPTIDESKLTEGEKILLQMQLFMSAQLASNSQVGIGQVIGLNTQVANNVKIS